MKVSVPHTKETSKLFEWAEPASLSGQRRTASAQPFEFAAITDYDRSDVQAAWQRLLAARRSPEQLYQLPEFFQYLRDTARPGESACELHVVRRNSDGQIVGIVPGRKVKQTLGVRIGPLTLFERNVPVYQVLGSVPLLDADEDGLPAFVMKSLLRSYPDCRALLMQAMPEELVDTVGGKGLTGHVMNGWQSCHTVPLPEDVETYLQKFSSKKRYNLSRQVRLLAKEAGEVNLVRVEHAHQAEALSEGLRSLLSAGEFAAVPSQAKLESLANHGLLHSYLLQCNGQTVALVFGTRSHTVWHVHKILGKQEYMSFSVGASVMHLALQDTIEHFAFTLADFGYGTPNHEFRSTHVQQRRGKLLLYRRHGLNSMLFKLHGLHDWVNEALIGHVKTMRKWLKQRRQAAQQT